MMEEISEGDNSTQHPVSRPVDRLPEIDRSHFNREYLSGFGSPVILTEVMKSWKATHKWTFDYFSSAYGDRLVGIVDQMLGPTKALQLPLEKFVAYCKASQLDKFDRPLPPRYCALSLFGTEPNLLDDFAHPEVAPTIYNSLEGDARSWFLETFGVIFIGSHGTFTPLHRDLFSTHGWLAQVSGRKHWLLFAPSTPFEKLDFAYDLENRKLRSSKALHNSTPYEATVYPGEVIFVPQGWFHRVTALDATISFGFNYVNETNYLAHILGISRDLQHWGKRLEHRDMKLLLGLERTIGR